MIELNKIYNEDCLSGMKRIPDGSVDAIICDLPYGTTQNPWDCIIPMEPLWEQYRRVIKPGGAIVLFSQQPFASKLVMAAPDLFRYEWIWRKDSGTGFLNARCAPLKIHENILVFGKGGCSPTAKEGMKYNPQYRKGSVGYKSHQGRQSSNYGEVKPRHFTYNDGEHYYPLDILEFQRDADKIHPTQKPVNLLRYLIRTYTDEGDTVLDNCMGSGATAVACIKEKRNFIGFELDPEYHKKAEQRVANIRNEPELF